MEGLLGVLEGYGNISGLVREDSAGLELVPGVPVLLLKALAEVQGRSEGFDMGGVNEFGSPGMCLVETLAASHELLEPTRGQE